MTTTLLRHLWQVIENTQANTLLHQADAPLVDALMLQLTSRLPLSEREQQLARTYLQAHIVLIRDVADARLHPLHPVAA